MSLFLFLMILILMLLVCELLWKLANLNLLDQEAKPLVTISSLSAIGENQVIEFGKILKNEEPKWLLDVIKYSIYQQTKNSALAKESTPPKWS